MPTDAWNQGAVRDDFLAKKAVIGWQIRKSGWSLGVKLNNIRTILTISFQIFATICIFFQLHELWWFCRNFLIESGKNRELLGVKLWKGGIRWQTDTEKGTYNWQAHGVYRLMEMRPRDRGVLWQICRCLPNYYRNINERWLTSWLWAIIMQN